MNFPYPFISNLNTQQFFSNGTFQELSVGVQANIALPRNRDPNYSWTLKNPSPQIEVKAVRTDILEDQNGKKQKMTLFQILTLYAGKARVTFIDQQFPQDKVAREITVTIPIRWDIFPRWDAPHFRRLFYCSVHTGTIQIPL